MMDRLKGLPIDHHARTVAVALSLLTFVACSSKDGAAADSTSHDSTSTASGSIATNDASSGAPKGRIHLEVSGGDNAGTYDVVMKDGGCSYGLADEDTWGNQYSIDTKDPKQLSSLQLVVPAAKAAGSGTSQFQLSASFGPLFGSGGHTYDVNTRPHQGTQTGSGTVTVKDQGSTGKVTFDAKTANGVGLKGTIDCQSVMRNG